MAKRVLVTGATGFIGQHLVQALRQQGAQVRCLVRATSNIQPLQGLDVTLVQGDLTRPESLQAAMAQVQVVYHLAAALEGAAQKLMQVNAGGTRNLLEACLQLAPAPKVVLVSSLAAGGPSRLHQPLREDQPGKPVSDYGRSKLAAERLAHAYAPQVQITIVRPPLVFGPYDREVLRMFKLVAGGWHLVPWRGRGRRYAVLHAADLAQFLILAADQGERLPPPGAGRPGQGLYYVAAQHPTYADLGRMIAHSMGRSGVRVVRLPGLVTWIVALGFEVYGRLGGQAGVLSLDKAREAMAGPWDCSNEKATRLGFRPQAALPTRLQQTWRWYKDQGWL